MTEPSVEPANEQKKAEENGTEEQVNGDNAANDAKKEESVKEMRAIMLLNFGGYKGVKILNKPEPSTPQAGEILIRVKTW